MAPSRMPFDIWSISLHYYSHASRVSMLHGISFSRSSSDILVLGRFLKRYVRYFFTSISFAFAVSMIEKYFTVASAPSWLFADTPKGVKASADVYSIIETAKANGLNIYTYLQYLFIYLPDLDWRNHPELLDDLMPWAKRVKDECSQK